MSACIATSACVSRPPVHQRPLAYPCPPVAAIVYLRLHVAAGACRRPHLYPRPHAVAVAYPRTHVHAIVYPCLSVATVVRSRPPAHPHPLDVAVVYLKQLTELLCIQVRMLRLLYAFVRLCTYIRLLWLLHIHDYMLMLLRIRVSL